MRLRTKRQILRFSTIWACFACVIVAPVILVLYPREDWLWELSLSLSLTVSLTMSITAYIGTKLRQIGDLTDELRRLVERDRLTDVATRDHFFDQLAQKPDGYGVSLMVDIDHFKQVNDTFGHIVGDAVIRKVARLLRQTVRSEDIVCRFGGEEFVVFLAEAGQDDAAALAERMRSKVEGASIQVDDQSVRVTVSIGGSLRERISEIDTAIEQADASLYRAKKLGRNRVELAEDITLEAPLHRAAS